MVVGPILLRCCLVVNFLLALMTGAKAMLKLVSSHTRDPPHVNLTHHHDGLTQ